MRYALVTLILSCLEVSAESVVRVRPHVVVSPQAQVTLAHIVDDHGLARAFVLKLNAVALMRAPEYGERMELSQAAAMEALRPLVMAERRRSRQNIRLVVPKNIVVDTVKRGMSAEQVTAELVQAWQPLCGDCQLEVDGVSLPRVESVRDWTLKIKAEIPRGSFSVPVELIRDDGSSFPAWVSGRVVLKKKVPVAKRVLQMGERVQSDDYRWEYRDISFSMDGVPQADELTGKRIKQGIRAGDVLWMNALEKEKAVRRGDLVQVRSGSDQWEVSLRVIAEGDAYIGDVINLKNPKTNSLLVGQVTGRGEVELR